MTYLQAVNAVLRRLRERSVSAYNQTVYSTMVGDFINDAKREIEQAWEWNALRSIVSVSATLGTNSYALTGFGQEGRVISAWNDTQNCQLTQVPQSYLDRQNYTANSSTGAPDKFAFRGVDASDDAKVEIYPSPDASYTLKFNCYIPQAELAADATEISIPWRPIVLLAVAMLSEEKGESDGTTSLRYFEMANKALSDAIAADMALFPDEMTWYEI